LRPTSRRSIDAWGGAVADGSAPGRSPLRAPGDPSITWAELAAREGVTLGKHCHGRLEPLPLYTAGKPRALQSVVINGAEVQRVGLHNRLRQLDPPPYFTGATAHPDRVPLDWQPPTVSGETAPANFVPIPLGLARVTNWLDLENELQLYGSEPEIGLDDEAECPDPVSEGAPDFDHNNPDVPPRITGNVTASERIGTASQVFSPAEQSSRRETMRDRPKRLATRSRTRRKPDGMPRIPAPKPLLFLDPSSPKWSEATHGHHRPEHRWALYLVHGIAMQLATPDTRTDRHLSPIWGLSPSELAGCPMRKAYVTPELCSWLYRSITTLANGGGTHLTIDEAARLLLQPERLLEVVDTPLLRSQLEHYLSARNTRANTGSGAPHITMKAPK
jgi:hypothetical protein